ncbi:MAG: signal recognition particle protein [Cycloclasticus sp.]|jgi:signal recognition particle subunit SRP54|nr:signal recognition particle protein [Cycloclasticus sp.]MDF1688599.1 signal recognition particle protein [Cycloclasticus sp.]MEE4291534.1 signal recognition particle protein [Cycloclasticus sp.]
MFDNLTDRLNATFKNIRGQGRLTESNIKDTMREVRMALLEADVALPVVKEFTDVVKDRALGQEVMQSLSPGQAMLKIVNDELVKTMGEANESLDLSAAPPVVILMAGLQGSGKTTTVAKLSRLLIERHKKSVMVVSADVYRPAAIDQLQTLAAEVGAKFSPSTVDQKPVNIVNDAITQATKQFSDVLIVDTAGRLHIDDDMMDEIRQVHAAANPAETLFVVDSMTGQDAANTAKAFNDVLPLTGVVLTKTDGDARGGAALSIRQITGKPIKFLGIGEKTDALEPFHPDRVASRLLGMGDALSLVEEIERKVDKEKAEKLAKKIQKGKGFDLDDYKDQLSQMMDMGGMSAMMDKIPGMSNVPQNVKSQVNDKDFTRQIALINSMTRKEKTFPNLINGSRRKRIAAGAGLQVQDVNKLMKQYKQAQKMMKKMSKGGMAKMMRGLKGQLGQGQGSPF